jgi:Methylamine utilisation protein MauE
VIGLVFVASAFSKLRSAEAFRSFGAWLAGLPGMPARGRPEMAVAVVAAEVGCVLLVALPFTVPFGMALAAVVLAVFAAGTFVAARGEAPEPCRCFGVSSVPLGLRHVARDVLLCAVAALGTVAALGAAGSAAAADRLPGIVLSLCAGLVLSVLAIFLDDIAAILLGPRAG